MNTGPATTANAAPVEEGHGEDEQAPPDEHLAEVVGVREYRQRPLVMKRPRFSSLALKLDFCASATASIRRPVDQSATPAIVHGPASGASSRPRR